ncbi:MAG TPA: metal-dependent hydrolase [Methylomirabilota bacterium]
MGEPLLNTFMATPLGHYLFGLALAAGLARDGRERAHGPWLAAVACVPDLDVIPGLVVGDPSRFHHGVTHSLTAAVLFAGAFAALGTWAGRRATARLVVLVAVLYASHSVLDALTLDLSDPRGVPLLWPWRDTTYESPWLLLPNVQHTREPVVSAHNALLMVREAVVFLPLIGLVRAVRGCRGAWAAAATWIYASCFAAATAVSVASLPTR